MNSYLITLGNNISDIRQTLNLTQEELANMMGVSRPTLLKIEQDPTKLTKTLAFALFCSVAIEIKRRVKEIREISAEDYSKIEQIYKLVDKLKAASAVSTVNLGKIATVSTLVPGISSFITTALKGKFNSLKENALQQLKTSANWDLAKATNLIKEVEIKVLEAEQECLNYFKLSSWDLESFGRGIDEGELGK